MLIMQDAAEGIEEAEEREKNGNDKNTDEKKKKKSIFQVFRDFAINTVEEAELEVNDHHPIYLAQEYPHQLWKTEGHLQRLMERIDEAFDIDKEET